VRIHDTNIPTNDADLPRAFRCDYRLFLELGERRQVQAEPQVRPSAVIPKELTSYRDIVKQTLPAVVIRQNHAAGIDDEPGAKPPVGSPFGPRALNRDSMLTTAGSVCLNDIAIRSQFLGMTAEGRTCGSA